MRKLVLAVVLCVGVANAGVARFGYAHAVKPAAKVSYKAVKIASFPVRHPRKSEHAVAHGGRAVYKVGKAVLY